MGATPLNDLVRESLLGRPYPKNVIQQRLGWFGRVEGKPVDRIPHNAPHKSFEG